MSNSLKNVVESSASTLSDTFSDLSDTFSDLVGEARSRIEDLPVLARPRHRRARRRWGSVALLALVAVLLLAMTQKSRHQDADPVDQTSVRRR
jgi:hypothetical protein